MNHHAECKDGTPLAVEGVEGSSAMCALISRTELCGRACWAGGCREQSLSRTTNGTSATLSTPSGSATRASSAC